MSSKQIAVEKEYMQIKSNYENDLTNMDEIYTRLSEYNVQFESISVNKANGTISATISLSLATNVKELKYGWIDKDTEVEVTNLNPSEIGVWTYVENTENPITVKLNNVQSPKYYYLCCMINNKAYWSNPIEVVED